MIDIIIVFLSAIGKTLAEPPIATGGHLGFWPLEKFSQGCQAGTVQNFDLDVFGKVNHQ